MIMDKTTYKIGKLEVTRQAFIVFVALTIPSVITAVLGIANASMLLVASSIFTFAVACYMTYVINCLVVGKCVVLSWILASLVVVFTLFNVIGMVAIALKLRRK